VEHVLEQFYGWLINEGTPLQISRKEYFQGFDHDCNSKKIVMDLCNIIVKKYIWDCKLRFTLPEFSSLKSTFISEYSLIYNGNRSVRTQTQKSNIFTGNIEIRF